MECSNQAEGYVHTLKSGETVFFYNDHSTGEQEPLTSCNTTTWPTNNTTAGFIQTCNDYCHNQEVTRPSMHSISTQTDHTAMHTSSIGMGTIYDSSTFNTPTRYNSAATETDLKAVGDRTTLEGILKWALAICRSLPIASYEHAQSASEETHITHPVSENAECEQYSDDETHVPSLHERQENNIFCNTQMDNISDTYAIGSSTEAVSVPRNDVCQQYSDRAGAIVIHKNENCGNSKSTFIRGRVGDTLDNEISAVVKERTNYQEPDTEMEEERDGLFDEPTQVNPNFALRERCCIEVESAVHGKICYNSFEQSQIEPMTDNPASFGNSFNASECPQIRTERSMVVHVPSHDVQADLSSASDVSYEGQGEDETEAVCEIRKCSASDGPRVQLEHSMVEHVPEGEDNTGTLSEVRGDPFMCTMCGKCFCRKGSMEFHSRTVHNNERPFVCEQCGKRFKTKNGLRVHRHVHLRADERPYLCTICNKRFTQAGALKNHMFIHSNEKPFRCTMCDRGFNHPSNLRAHLIVHKKGRT